MKNLVFLICIAFSMTFYSCGSTKGYVGPRLESTSLATINQGTNKLTIDKRKTQETALLIQVDSISVGDYFKGYPTHCSILPGSHTVEIRHLQKWNDHSTDAAIMGGLFGGIIGAAVAGSIAESSNTHKHYLITFDAVVGHSYTIKAVTDPETLDVDIYVSDDSNGERIESTFVLKEDEKRKE